MTKSQILKNTELDSLFIEIEKKISFFPTITPTNIATEFEKFIVNSCKYNPHFEYYVDQELIENYLELLNTILPENSDFKILYEEKIQSMIDNLSLLQSVGSKDFSEKSIKIFGETNKKYVEIAKGIVHINFPKLKSEKIFYTEIINTIKSRLKIHKLSTQIVERSDEYENTAFRVSQLENKIYIHKNTVKSRDQLNGTLAHEIDTHLFRAKNGKEHECKLFFINTANYIPDEEGVANLMTYKAKTNKSMRLSAIKYLTLDHSINNDFVSTFNFLKNYLTDDKKCFMSILRLKRGIGDTSLPGSFTKDKYFEWTIEVGRRIIKNPEIIGYLFNGKADIDSLIKYTKPIDHKLLSIKDIKEVFEYNNLNTE